MKGKIPFVASVTLLVSPMIAVCIFEVYAKRLQNIQIQNVHVQRMKGSLNSKYAVLINTCFLNVL
jgi:hypothetical protein